jgi:L-histidine N-alpha-methyltransferase
MGSGAREARIVRLREDAEFVETMAREVAAGLETSPRTIPSKYFYDAHGSVLFDQITELPEYYLARAETAILEQVAPVLVAEIDPAEIVELGAGFSRKTRLLLDTLEARGGPRRFVPLDVSREALEAAGDALAADYPWLSFEGFIGDFERDLARLPRHGRRLVLFLGSTIGNLHPDDRIGFCRAIRASMAPDDALLVGMDLVKDPRRLEAAYDDAAGVTAAFNLNVLRVLNRALDGDNDLEAFDHVARWDPQREWMEMNLRVNRPTRLAFRRIHVDVELAAGEEIRTELSCKFTRASAERALTGGGFRIARWDTDPAGDFVLVLARPA